MSWIDRRMFMGCAGALGAGQLLGRSARAAPVQASQPAQASQPGKVPTSDLLAHVHPELRTAAEQMQRMSGPSDGPVEIAKLVGYRSMMPVRPQLPAPGVERKAVAGSNSAPDVRVYVINARPGGSRPVILHLHGGGFVMGSAGGDLASLQTEALALDCIIVTVDYRLAPEAPFPAPLEDAYAALSWTYRNCASLGADPKRIAVQGESAGGGLAAMLALAARNRGEIPLVHQSLIYPMLDDHTGSAPIPFPIGRLAWTAPANQTAWTAFLGQPAGGKSVPNGAVPARAGRLDRLPGAFVGVGSIDLFVGEDIDYARRLIEAAVPTELLVVPGAFHGFDLVAPQTHVVRQFRLAQLNALANAFGSEPPKVKPE
jgi:acetyl esterase/lipase